MEIAGQDAELPEIRRRARTSRSSCWSRSSAIAGRLFYLQVIEGDVFFRVTSDSIIRTEVLPAVRGQIRDRKGKVLATVRPVVQRLRDAAAREARGVRAAARRCWA